MFIIKSIVLFLLFTNALAFKLTDGESAKVFDDNKSLIPLVWEKIYLSNRYPDALLKFTEDEYYYLSSNNIYKYKFSLNNIGHWPLTLWPHESIEKEVLDRFELVNRSYKSRFSLHSDTPLGCLNTAPLRYGDIEDDNKNELVLFIGNDLMVFSPEYQKTVFGVKLRIDDWFDEAETARYFELNTYEAGRAVKPQYQSATNVDYTESIPGHRGYGKLYTGDFNQNGKSDIVVWRKLYLSNMTDNPQKGFTKVKDNFYHFERDLTTQTLTGEYLLQETTADQIQAWLTTNNLTWQKGYPSTSECPGQESQLIPEMHDPLLNDPEVLQ